MGIHPSQIPVKTVITIVLTDDNKVLIADMKGVPLQRWVALGVLEQAKLDLDRFIQRKLDEVVENVVEIAPAGLDKKIPAPNFGG